jgi:biopolymer transport protein ExbD
MNLTKRRHSRLDPSGMRLPLIALIDVVLFLLFYFMVAGSLALEEGELQSTLQAAKGRASGAMQSQVLSVGIDGGGGGGITYAIGSRSVRTVDALRTILTALPKDVGIILKVDGRAPVDAAAGAMQAAQDAGFTKITYLATE